MQSPHKQLLELLQQGLLIRCLYLQTSVLRFDKSDVLGHTLEGSIRVSRHEGALVLLVNLPRAASCILKSDCPSRPFRQSHH